VVLVAVRNPLNIGAAGARYENFGFSRLRRGQPYEAAFREARSAVGASELLANAESIRLWRRLWQLPLLWLEPTAGVIRELQHPLRSVGVWGAAYSQEIGRWQSRAAVWIGKMDCPTLRLAIATG